MFFALLGIENWLLYFLEFLLASAVVLFVSGKLAVYADKLADESKLTSGWIGFILLASITSLPELFTGIAATGIVGSVDLVVSDAIGSSAFNIVVLAMMFLIARKSVVDLKTEESLTAYAGMALIALVGFFILSNTVLNLTPLVSIVYSVAIVAVYALIVSAAFRAGGLKEEESEGEVKGGGYVWKFTVLAVLILGASVWLTKTAGLIAETPFALGTRQVTLGETFVGALLVSIATALPEIAVTIKSALLGNVTLGISNILGSNLFNMLILPVSAIFYRGNFWKDVHPSNILLAILTLLLTAVMLFDLSYRTKMKRKGVTLPLILTIVLWTAAMALLFALGTGVAL